MPVVWGTGIWHLPMIFSAGPPGGGPAEKIKIASVSLTVGRALRQKAAAALRLS
ncbi:hypothetical protein K227x_19000 [Rubripirellula lacrimiformis]|uniref:Uncharacterized protein n=1 Tax=Rubripirellula lacrimiformis TaxID=1930273 RepID=A0A517N8P9_9BACT|nr:hypothetical protein K227x_19000 [Rubripirellula lacrimiformis]